MTWAFVSAVSVLAASVAAAYPYVLPASSEGELSAKSRADWIGRLMVLSAEADAAGEPAIGDSARSLVTALIGPTAKKGKS